MIEEANLTMQELVRLDASVPILLKLRELKKSYRKELEHELRVSSLTVRRGINFLKEYDLIKTIPADGEIPNVKEYLCLSKSGRRIAESMHACSLSMSRVAKKKGRSEA